MGRAGNGLVSTKGQNGSISKEERTGDYCHGSNGCGGGGKNGKQKRRDLSFFL